MRKLHFVLLAAAVVANAAIAQAPAVTVKAVQHAITSTPQNKAFAEGSR